MTLTGDFGGTLTANQIAEVLAGITRDGVNVESRASVPIITDPTGTKLRPNQVGIALIGATPVSPGAHTYSAKVTLSPIGPATGLVFNATNLVVIVQDILP
jgi:hypothetical protein